MKNLFAILFLLFASICFGQVDTAFIERQVDSLLELSKSKAEEWDFDKAMEFNLQANQLAEQHFGEESLIYGRTCFNRGRLLLVAKDYSAAEKWLNISKGINERLLGKDDSRGVYTLNVLGVLYLQIGELEKAKEILLDTKSIIETNFGKEDVRYLQSLLFLGMIGLKTGDYFSAEHYLLEVLSYVKGKSDAEYEALHISCNNMLGVVYSEMNNLEKAELIKLETLKLTEEKYGKESMFYAQALSNLGTNFVKAKAYRKAESTLLEVDEIMRKIVGEGHLELSQNLNALGSLYLKLGNMEKAAVCLSEAEAILVDHNAEWQLIYAVVLDNISIVKLRTGMWSQAQDYLKKSRMSLEKNTGKIHHGYINHLLNWDKYYLVSNDFENAFINAQEINEINKQRAVNASHHLSEFELSNFISEFSNEQSRFFSYSQLYGGGNDALYDNALFYKGYLLNNIGEAERLAKEDSASSELYVELKTLRRNMENGYEKPLSERMNIQELEAKAEAVEKELIRTVAGFSDVTRQVKWEEVEGSLEVDEVAIEFVHYNFYSPHLTDSTLYGAILIRNNIEEPQWIPLFEEKELKEFMSNNRANASENISELYSEEMSQLIWEPLEPYLTNIRKIHYSPSGLLHRINLPAINMANGKRLMDKYQMHYVSSTRQLVVKGEHGNSLSDVVIYGGLEYEMDTTAVNELPMAYEGGRRGGSLLGNILDTEVPTRGRIWYGLPKTEEERKKIENLFREKGKRTVSLNRQAGTEEHFKSLSKGTDSPSVIHLATHGFFFPDPEIKKEEQGDYLSGGQSNFRFSDDPLFRSGIILSGGNLAWKGGQVPEGREDGILSAYEISNMDLSGTELAVLSACETGLGDIVGSEGVYGLQRAFKKAGVDYLIMTLWSISDSDETVDFMETFYRHLLSGKKVPQAFSVTQKEMKDKYDDPYYWAGFVLVE